MGRLVDQHGAELELGEPGISASHAGAANDVRVPEDLALARPGERLELALVAAAQLSLLRLELDELLELRVRVAVGDLRVEREVRHGRLERLA